jgi:hypothetical protein
MVETETVTELQSGIVAIEVYLQFKRIVFGYKNLFPFPLATAFLIGIVLTNRQSGDKMLFLALTAPIYWRI